MITVEFSKFVMSIISLYFTYEKRAYTYVKFLSHLNLSNVYFTKKILNL